MSWRRLLLLVFPALRHQARGYSLGVVTHNLNKHKSDMLAKMLENLGGSRLQVDDGRGDLPSSLDVLVVCRQEVGSDEFVPPPDMWSKVHQEGIGASMVKRMEISVLKRNKSLVKVSTTSHHNLKMASRPGWRGVQPVDRLVTRIVSDKGMLSAELVIEENGEKSTLLVICASLPGNIQMRNSAIAHMMTKTVKKYGHLPATDGSTVRVPSYFQGHGQTMPMLGRVDWPEDFDGIVFAGDLNMRFRLPSDQMDFLRILDAEEWGKLVEFDTWSRMEFLVQAGEGLDCALKHPEKWPPTFIYCPDEKGNEMRLCKDGKGNFPTSYNEGLESTVGWRDRVCHHANRGRLWLADSWPVKPFQARSGHLPVLGLFRGGASALRAAEEAAEGAPTGSAGGGSAIGSNAADQGKPRPDGEPGPEPRSSSMWYLLQAGAVTAALCAIGWLHYSFRKRERLRRAIEMELAPPPGMPGDTPRHAESPAPLEGAT